MPKKITIVSASALILLIAVILITVKLTAKKPSDAPERISVYDSAAGVIYTPGYETFLAGCVEGLLTADGSEFEQEALNAIAVAQNARIKYFLKMKSGFENLGADLSVNEDIPYSDEAPSTKARAAARYALSRELTYGGEPFNAPICKISSGRTDECPPYSPSVGLPCDEKASGFAGSAAFTPEELRAALDGGNLSYNCGEWLENPVYGENGTLLFVTFDGKNVSGEELKKALGLRSTAISARFSEDKFIFTTKGLGNNKGLSVNAANFLAKKGKTAGEILDIFYPDCDFKVVK